MRIEINKTVHLDENDLAEAVIMFVRERVGYRGDITRSDIDLETCSVVARLNGAQIEADLHIGVKGSAAESAA